MLRWHPHGAHPADPDAPAGFWSKLKDLAISTIAWLFFIVPLLSGFLMIPYALYQLLVKPAVDFFSPPAVTAAPLPTDTGPWGDEETTDEIYGTLARRVYWTPNGKSYHFNRNCPSLSRSTEIISGTLSEAIDTGHADPCNNCVK